MESTRRTRGRTKSDAHNSSSDETKPNTEVNGEESPLESIENIQKELEGRMTSQQDTANEVEFKPPNEESEKTQGKKQKVTDSGPSGDEYTTSPQPSPLKDATDKVDLTQELSPDLELPPKQTLGKGKRARIPNKRYSDILLSPASRSQSKPQAQNGEKIESESELSLAEDPSVLSLKSRSNTSSPASKRLKISVDVTNPMFRKPFEFGWKRELVYRGTFENPLKRNGDIYYYTPSGKKLRSMKEIGENLKHKELTLDNFTFFKEPLGLNDPEREIIRDAKPMNKGVTRGKTASPKIQSPKLPTPKTSAKPAPAAKVANAKNSVEETTPSKPKMRNIKGEDTDTNSVVEIINEELDHLSPATSVFHESEKLHYNRRLSDIFPKDTGNHSSGMLPLKPIKQEVKVTPKRRAEKKAAKIEEEPMEVDTPPPVVAPTKRGTRKSTKSTPNLTGGGGGGVENKPCQPCSIRCQGVLGMVPTLQCRLCLCLYHYECVGLSPHVQVEAYICKNCQLEHGQSAASASATAPPSIVLPPLAPMNASQSVNLPNVQCESFANQDCGGGGNGEHVKNPNENSKSLVGSVTSWLPHSSTIQVEARNKENEPASETRRPQYVEYLAGRKFLIIPKHNVVSVSPTSAPARVAPLANFNVATRAEAVLGFGTQFRPFGGAKGFGGLFGTDKEDLPEPAESPKGKKRANMRSNNTEKGETFVMATDNHLQNFSYLYNSMLHVFQYLKVQDLLRASCVCTLWRDIASHPLLWRTVRMKNSQVHSFDGLANSLRKHGTVHLDLRKMLLPNGGGDEIWPEFSSAIAKVTTLRKIELCRCPASVVEQLSATNLDLEVINAVTIKCESMSLDRLSALKNLKELRLKSTSTLSLSSDITGLKELVGLKALSLTSIKDLNTMDLSVIASLINLESLDLGECVDFPTNFGDEVLVKLTNLEKLRLEKGQGECHTFAILQAAKSMPQLEQLELVNFDIKSGFDLALGACANIKKLLIIPTYISQSATTNHMVLGGVLRLQSTLSHFVWGVTLELLRVTELFVDQCEDSDKKEKKEQKSSGNGDSIPVLKPVPLISNESDEIPPAHDPPQVEILPLPNLQKLLLQSLPTTRVKILKIPFHATWRQSITDTVS